MANMSKIPCSRNSTDPIIVNLNYTTWWCLKCHVMSFWFISTQSSPMSLLVSTWGKPLTWEGQIPYTGTLPWSKRNAQYCLVKLINTHKCCGAQREASSLCVDVTCHHKYQGVCEQYMFWIVYLLPQLNNRFPWLVWQNAEMLNQWTHTVAISSLMR